MTYTFSHLRTKQSINKYKKYKTDRLQPFTESFFESDQDNLSANTEDMNVSVNSVSVSPFEELRQVRLKHPNKFLIAHLNINSLKSKFVEIHEILIDKVVDLLFLSETKLDSTYRDSIFDSPGYKVERRERNLHGGGIAAFIRSDIPSRRCKELECNELENITYEVIRNKSKWCFICIYKSPNFSDEPFCSDLSKTADML